MSLLTESSSHWQVEIEVFRSLLEARSYIFEQTELHIRRLQESSDRAKQYRLSLFVISR
jgi:hypothetical protein